MRPSGQRGANQSAARVEEWSGDGTDRAMAGLESG